MLLEGGPISCSDSSSAAALVESAMAMEAAGWYRLATPPIEPLLLLGGMRIVIYLINPVASINSSG